MVISAQVEIEQLATRVGAALSRRGAQLAIAESCTGGWVAQTVTSVPGSSAWFDRGFVTYTNIAKQEMLGVTAAMLEANGAVSEETARAMAEGALRHSHAQLSLAVSGVAGPAGGTPNKQVGCVCLAWAGLGIQTLSQIRYFSGSRTLIRQQAVSAALQGLLDFLTEPAAPT
jgi:nicotinamide-nucleotide amidase